MYNKLLLIVFTIGCYYQLASSFSLEQFMRMRRVMGNAKILQYGNNCSWEAEEARQNLSKLLFTGNAEGVMKITRDFEERGDKLCADGDLYVCDRESEKCVCGDQGYESLLGVNRPIFVLEGSDKCRWDTDSYCIPEDSRKWPAVLDASSPHSLCKTGTMCRSKDGELCSKDTISQYFRKMRPLDTTTIWKEWISNKICSCVVNTVEQESSA